MNIQGLQKLTLLDYPGKLACTIFTGLCNLRCPFCHNSSLISRGEGALEWNEIERFLKSRVGILEGVCVTGGEPTLHQALGEYLAKIKGLGFFVKLDTNGTKPDVLENLVSAGLVDYVALDVKNSPSRYGETVGLENFDHLPIKASIEFLLRGKVDYEFRTTAVREFHDAAALLELAAGIRGAKRYYLQAFEDGEDVLQDGLHAYSKGEMNYFKGLVNPIVPSVRLRGI